GVTRHVERIGERDGVDGRLEAMAVDAGGKRATGGEGGRRQRRREEEIVAREDRGRLLDQPEPLALMAADLGGGDPAAEIDAGEKPAAPVPAVRLQDRGELGMQLEGGQRRPREADGGESD